MYNLLKPMRKALIAMLFLLGFIIFSGCSESSNDPDSALPLSGPESVQVVPGNGQLALMWTAVAPAQGVEASYIVYVGTRNDPAAAEPSDVVPAAFNDSQLITATVTGLSNDRVYFVWVETVFGSLGRAEFTPVASGTPIPPAATPANITITPGESLLLVRWTPSPRTTSYAVAYSETGGTNPPDNAEIVIVYTNSALLTGLTNDTTYYVWVMGSNTAGDSAYSAVSSEAPAESTIPPETPSIKSVETRNKRLTVTWDAITSAKEYQLHWTDGSVTDSVLIAPTAAAEVSHTISGLTNGTAYSIYLVAVNNAGSSPDSAVANGTPVANPPLNYNVSTFVIANATADFINSQNVPPSPFWPDGVQNKDRLTRVKETALGNLFADGLAWYIRDRYPEENLDFVLLNGGYIDSGTIPYGQVTIARVISVVKSAASQNQISILTLKGSDVKVLFNDHVAKVAHRVGTTGGGTGGWGITSSEVRYTISYPAVDMSVPGPNWDSNSGRYKAPATPEIYYTGVIKQGTLKINGADFDDDAYYRLATTDYMAAGGDDYLVFPTKGTDRRDIFNFPLYRAVIEYIYDLRTITPYLDGRLVIEGGVPMGGQEPQPPYK